MARNIASFICLIYLIKSALANPSCPKLKPGMVNVHLVCHTHDDVGWLKTVDQYYYGANKWVTWVGVQYILDSVVDSLLKDENRKFIFVESAFFFRWWDEQNEQMKNKVKKLVQSGQLEFIGGGWSMNDEAGAHYNAIIDQMTLGLVMLNDTFGDVAFPRIAWQIDPFGHSKEQASLFAQMGMDGLFFGRLDHDDKSHRWNTRQMEMVWKASDSLGESAWLFTGVLPNGYSPPKDFCFDLLCGDEPIMDDPKLADYNKDKKVSTFLQAVKAQSQGYASSNLIMTMGEDFNYVYAESWYKNLDKLMKYVNGLQVNGSKVNLVYSTPSCYLDALHKDGIKWPTKSDDFFPYASDPHAYWTGYFTSRPTFKGYIRQSNNLLQAIKQIAVLTGSIDNTQVEKLSRAMAVAQHHDAVTGTAKQHVTDDYYKRLSQGTEAAYEIFKNGLRKLVYSENHLPGIPAIEHCNLMNISACSYTESAKEFTVFVYNPVSRVRSSYIRLPVIYNFEYEVLDSKQNKLETQLINIPKKVQDVPGRNSKAKYELVFYAEDLQPLGVNQFLVRPKNKKLDKRSFGTKIFRHNDELVLHKGKLSLVLDAKTNKLKSIGVLGNNSKLKQINVTQDWFWYAGMRGNNTQFKYRASGAYIFRPAGSVSSFTNKAKLTGVYDGPLVSEIQQEWGPYVSQILRIYKHKNFVEIEWLVGPIPIEDGIGKEIINRVEWKDMKTNDTFYTDANGREMQKRVKDHRDAWNLVSSEPVSQNYYPVTSRLNLHSTNGKGCASILNDRAQGGSSLSDGAMELMVHRRLLDDDAFGVGEPLNETAFGEGLVVRGMHYLVHSDFSSTDCDFGCQHRTLGEELLLKPVLTFSSANSFTGNNIQNDGKYFLGTPLPENMRILTLEPRKDGQWLLRFENFYEAGESSKSGTSVINIRKLLAIVKIESIREVTLGANRFKNEHRRLKWKISDDNSNDPIKNDDNMSKNNDNTTEDEYTFTPMQIRTFIVKVVSR